MDSLVNTDTRTLLGKERIEGIGANILSDTPCMVAAKLVLKSTLHVGSVHGVAFPCNVSRHVHGHKFIDVHRA